MFIIKLLSMNWETEISTKSVKFNKMKGEEKVKTMYLALVIKKQLQI